jgi:hypothetical protein
MPAAPLHAVTTASPTRPSLARRAALFACCAPLLTLAPAGRAPAAASESSVRAPAPHAERTRAERTLAQHGELPTGSYVAVLANGEKLPWTTQVPAVKGLVHWARLDLAVLRLSPNGRFTLSYRYAQEVVDMRLPLTNPPARDELSVGRYSGNGKTLTFVPTPAAGRTARTVTAQVVGEDIFLDKTVYVGERPFRVRLLFRRDPSLW